MDEKKRFQKKTLNKEDHKGMENGAKIVKSVAVALLAGGGLAVFNKDNIKTAVKAASSMIKKLH